MKARTQKWAALGTGAAVTFLLLEISIRVLGSFYQPLDTEDSSLRHVLADPDKSVVLCIGESVTYGIGATPGNDYPSQLQRRLNSVFEGEPFLVVNGGIAGANTAMIREKLPRYLEATEPAIFVLLAGCNNATNYYGYSSYLQQSSTLNRVLEVLYHVRTFRLIQYSTARLRQPMEVDSHQIMDGMEAAISAYLKWHESSGVETELSDHFLSGIDWLRLGSFEAAVQDFDLGRQELPDHAEHYWGLGVTHQGMRERETAVAWLEECIRVDPGNPNCYFGIGESYIESGRERPEARQWFEDGVAADPTFSGNYFGLGMVAMLFGPTDTEVDWFLQCVEADQDDARCYPNLVRCAMVDDGDRQRIESVLSKYAKTNRVARDTLRMLQANADRREIDAWIRADLGAIIDMAQSHGSEVVVQDYPVGLNENRVLRELAEERNLTFVGQQASFKAHYRWNGGQPDLFSLDRCHPNDDGYSLMTENLYWAIRNSEAVDFDGRGVRVQQER